MEQRNSRFNVKRGKLSFVLDALAALAFKPRNGHYAWVSNRVIQEAKTVAEHLQEWRWAPTFDEEGNLTALSFEGEKLGDDLQLFQAIAAYVEPGSFITMQGEEGDIWRWYFDGQQCLEQEASVQFADVGSDIIDVEAKDVTAESRSNRLLKG